MSRWIAAWKFSVPMLALTLSLAVAIVFGYWAAIGNREYARQVAEINRERDMDARQGRRDIELFLRQMCVQDAGRAGVVIDVLNESIRRARGVAGSEARVAQYKDAIRRLNELNERCVSNLPEESP